MTLEQVGIIASLAISALTAYKAWFGLVIEVKVLKAQFESENKNVLNQINEGFAGMRREMHLLMRGRDDE
jgi:hypothetical protein